MIRIVLVDDQTLVRQGIRSLLELAGDITIVGEAGDGDEGLAAIAREKPDVVLDDDEALLAAVKAGARGYLLKDVSLEQLTDAIRAVAAGGTVIRPAVTEDEEGIPEVTGDTHTG